MPDLGGLIVSNLGGGALVGGGFCAHVGRGGAGFLDGYGVFPMVKAGGAFFGVAFFGGGPAVEW